MTSPRPADTTRCEHGRRAFLKGVGVAAAASATVSATPRGARADAMGNGPFFTEPPADLSPLPEVDFLGRKMPRMIIGCNQVGGWSHAVPSLSQTMEEYFTPEVTCQFLRHCESWGLNTWITYWGKKPLGALRQRWEEGSRLRVYFLATLGDGGEISGVESKEEGSILEYKPLFLLHHGNVTDDLFRAGRQERVHDFVKKAHDVGLRAGVSAHNPDVFKYAEDHGWECDLYQCCLYYVTRPQEEIRAKLGTGLLGEPFLEGDRDDMLDVVRQVSKPCIAFKILGAGRLCGSDASVEEAFRHAFSKIKKGDVVIVGMWPRFRDEVAHNVALLKKYGAA